MADKYYYLIASLPSLKLGEPSPITRDDFLSECEKWLSPFDLAQILATDINDLEVRPRDCATVKEWKAFSLSLRAELAHIRQLRKTALHEKMPDFLHDIFNQPTPLLMERKFEEKKWIFLDENEFGHHFDIEILLIYFLKLQILERLSVFDREKGGALFEDLTEVRHG